MFGYVFNLACTPDWSGPELRFVRIGEIGIVAALVDGGAAASAWSHELSAINEPVSTIDAVEISLVPPLGFQNFDRAEFGHALAFALRYIIAAGGNRSRWDA